VIVLDEQLLGRDLDISIKEWYQGKVIFINDLRPNTTVKDDVIPQLLQATKKHPVFVTINVKDFWPKVAINSHFCVVCFKISDKQVSIIPKLLKFLFQGLTFSKKKHRAGHVFRITDDGSVRYCTYDDLRTRSLTI
jgi:hypothetical protein